MNNVEVKTELSNFQAWLRMHKDNYAELLNEKPYCIEVKHDNVFDKNLVLFKYNQIESDFNQAFVKLCRGLVLDANSFEPVVFPFVKFHNVNEKFADKIDWNTAKCTQKLDGSIIKIVKISPTDLLIGTNANIDAFKAPIADQLDCNANNFGELVLEGLTYYGLSKESLAAMLDYDVTYIFELTSPYNQVVVRWNETKLNFIGVRDNKTFQEQIFEDHPLSKVFNIPKLYDFKSEADCIAAADELPDSEEGYVIRDAEFNRVKIKSPKYLALHRLSGNGLMTYEHAIEIVRSNEIDEVVAYFPNFEKMLNDVKEKYEDLVNSLEASWSGFMSLVTPLASRKDAAVWIKTNFKIPGVGFALLDNKVKSVEEWLQTIPAKNLVKWMNIEKGKN